MSFFAPIHVPGKLEDRCSRLPVDQRVHCIPGLYDDDGGIHGDGHGKSMRESFHKLSISTDVVDDANERGTRILTHKWKDRENAFTSNVMRLTCTCFQSGFPVHRSPGP